MKKFEYWRLGAVLFVFFLSLIVSLPTLRLGGLSESLAKMGIHRMALGLDIQGGMDLTYRVKPIVKKGETATTDPTQLQKIASRTQEVLIERIDSLGVLNPRITIQGNDQIRVQIPSGDNAEEKERVKEILQTQHFLSFHEVIDSNTSAAMLDSSQPGTRIFPGVLPRDGGQQVHYLLKEDAEITGDLLANAEVGRNELNKPTILFAWKAAGAEIFSEVTARLKGRQLAIVLSGRVQSAPVIEERITTEGIIRGDFTDDEAKKLVQVLSLGALPAELEPLAENSVGPSLGHDAQVAAVRGAFVGVFLVFGFMILRYRASGVIAAFTLFANFLMQVTLLVWFDAVLTLPGIAGFALTVGMAVDANILIFERIREELKAGKPVRSAIASGYDKAFMAIFDSNLTTIITGLILYYLGTGPIRGFAVTMIIGLVVNLATALWMTRVLQDWKYSGREVATMSI